MNFIRGGLHIPFFGAHVSVLQSISISTCKQTCEVPVLLKHLLRQACHRTGAILADSSPGSWEIRATLRHQELLKAEHTVGYLLHLPKTHSKKGDYQSRLPQNQLQNSSQLYNASDPLQWNHPKPPDSNINRKNETKF